MSFKAENVVLRKARNEDYVDIIAIGDVKSGKDYLMSHWSSFVANPSMHLMVAELDGKAVGFYLNHILDDGQTVIKRAGRVHPSCRGQGIFHLLEDALDKHVRVECPGVMYESFATNDTVDRAKKEFQSKGFKEIVRNRIENWEFNAKDLKRIDQQNVFQLNASDLKSLFTNNEVATRLFPNKRIFNFFVGYRIIDANIPYLINDLCQVYGTTKSQNHQKEPKVTRNLQSQGHLVLAPDVINDLDIITFSYNHPSQAGHFYEIAIYAACGHTENSLRAHIEQHIANIRKLTDRKRVLMVALSSNVDEKSVMAILKDCGVCQQFSITENYQVLYEREIIR